MPEITNVVNNFRRVAAEEVDFEALRSGKRIAVFCSSSGDLKPIYHEHAARLGRELSKHQCALVYGGGSWGLMGEVARAAHNQSVPILGVLPDFMQSTSGPCYGQLAVVNSMAERKALIDRHADVFICLPGGFGTMDEMTEMLTWNQIGLNNKLVGILNTDGFYDDWWRWVQKAIREGFIKPQHTANLFIADTPEALMEEAMKRTPTEVPGKFRTRA